MLTLLAESKTMSANQLPIDNTFFKEHKPVLEEVADELMQHLASLSPVEISDLLGISTQLAVKTQALAYDFPHKMTGYKTISGFTGEAFRALDFKSIEPDKLTALDDKLRIISSVYGILKPSDIIKPYRCEFNKGVFNNNKTPIQIFKPKVTIEFVKYIKENRVKEVLDLLPGDADKCLDWKIIRAFTSVYKVCFKTITPEGKLKTPIANRLKELRGLMTRTILEQDINTFNELTLLQNEDFIFSPADSKPGLPVFICA